MVTAETIGVAYHRLGASRMDLIAPEAEVCGGRLIVVIVNDTFWLPNRCYFPSFLRCVVFVGQPDLRQAFDLKNVTEHLVSGGNEGVMRARGDVQSRDRGNPLTWPAAWVSNS